MMRVNQFYSNNAFTQNTQNRNSRNSNTPSFAGVMSNISGQQQPAQFMPQQSNTMQMPGMDRISGISGMQSNFPGMMMPGGNMPSGMPEMPSGEMPKMPSGMPDGTQPVDGQEPPAIPEGEDFPELPDGESLPEMPTGQTPPEMPAQAPSESDGNMPQPPFGGMNRMNSFRAMSFMNR